MAATNELEDDATIFSLDSASELPVSPDSVISSLQELQESLGLVKDLAQAESETLDSLFEVLGGMALTVTRIPLEPSSLARIGEVEAARLSPGGALIVTRPDGEIETFELSDPENRELLPSVIDDLMGKLRGFIEGSYVLPEPVERPRPRPIIKEVQKEIVAPEPKEVVEEPPALEETLPEEVLEEAEEEPGEEVEETIEEPEEALEEIPEVETPEIEVPEVIEPEAVEPPPVSIPTLSPARIEEPEPITRAEPVFEKPPVVAGLPPRPVNRLLNRHRSKVKRQRDEARRKMSEIRRLRDEQVRAMRTADKTNGPVLRLPTGILGSLKKLFSRRKPKVSDSDPAQSEE